MGLSESFGFEERWLRLGLKVLMKDGTIFQPSRISEAQIVLGGIGNRQVFALRDWMRGIGLITQLGSGAFELTPLAQVIMQYDPTLEEDGSYWVIHHSLCMNASDIWFYSYYANTFGEGSFSRDDIKTSFMKARNLSETVIEKKCITPLLHTMRSTKLGERLGILLPLEKDLYQRKAPSEANLPLPVFAYMIVDWTTRNTRTTCNTAELLQVGSVAKCLALPPIEMNQMLDRVQDRYRGRILTVSRTAGLNSVSFNNTIKPLAILRTYYIELFDGLDSSDSLNMASQIE